MNQDHQVEQSSGGLQHTPGPWRWWTTVRGARVAGHPADGSQNFVCDVLIPERAVSYEANARLIAATPKMLAALMSVRASIAIARACLQDSVDTHGTRGGWLDEEVKRLGEAQDECDAAIAAATGEGK